ncbi:MAG: hypothetical protein HFH60_03645 [Lachnospiraceae bacterium]|jgi:hypothetical protein|nr:hypothetical protein [Lachnospiraceae bacterium]
MNAGYIDVFEELDKNTDVARELLNILDMELSLPNIPFPTMGGEVFWNTLVEYNGWKLQQNMFTHHARILNSDNIRIAWGTINGMEKAMDRMVRHLHKYEKPASNSCDRLGSMEELKKLKELLDMGAITEQEFQDKKNKIMKTI